MLQVDVMPFASDALEDAMVLAQVKSLNSYTFSDCLNHLNYCWSDIYSRVACIDEGYYCQTVRVTSKLTKLPKFVANSIMVYRAQSPAGFNRHVYRAAGAEDMNDEGTYTLKGTELYVPDADRHPVWLQYVPSAPQLFFTHHNRDPKTYEVGDEVYDVVNVNATYGAWKLQYSYELEHVAYRQMSEYGSTVDYYIYDSATDSYETIDMTYEYWTKTRIAISSAPTMTTSARRYSSWFYDIRPLTEEQSSVYDWVSFGFSISVSDSYDLIVHERGTSAGRLVTFSRTTRSSDLGGILENGCATAVFWREDLQQWTVTVFYRRTRGLLADTYALDHLDEPAILTGSYTDSDVSELALTVGSNSVLLTGLIYDSTTASNSFKVLRTQDLITMVDLTEPATASYRKLGLLTDFSVASDGQEVALWQVTTGCAPHFPWAVTRARELTFQEEPAVYGTIEASQAPELAAPTWIPRYKQYVVTWAEPSATSSSKLFCLLVAEEGTTTVKTCPIVDYSTSLLNVRTPVLRWVESQGLLYILRPFNQDSYGLGLWSITGKLSEASVVTTILAPTANSYYSPYTFRCPSFSAADDRLYILVPSSTYWTTYIQRYPSILQLDVSRVYQRHTYTTLEWSDVASETTYTPSTQFRLLSRQDNETTISLTDVLQREDMVPVYVGCDFPYVFVSWQYTYAGEPADEYVSALLDRDVLKAGDEGFKLEDCLTWYNPYAFTGRESNVRYIKTAWNDKTGMGVTIRNYGKGDGTYAVEELGFTPDTRLAYPSPVMYRYLVARLADKFSALNESNVMGVQKELSEAKYAFEAFLSKDKAGWQRIRNVNGPTWDDYL